ncbi:MAG: FHA domain-containing protein [Bdellovibrionota bacterium]
MAKDNNFTFVKCPSCSSLVPALSTRCRMCGADIQAQDSNENSEPKKPRTSRVRQKTMTISEEKKDSFLEEMGVKKDTQSFEDDNVNPLSYEEENFEENELSVNELDVNDPLSSFIDTATDEEDIFINVPSEREPHVEEYFGEPIIDEPISSENINKSDGDEDYEAPFTELEPVNEIDNKMDNKEDISEDLFSDLVDDIFSEDLDFDDILEEADKASKEPIGDLELLLNEDVEHEAFEKIEESLPEKDSKESYEKRAKDNIKREINKEINRETRKETRENKKFSNSEDFLRDIFDEDSVEDNIDKDDYFDVRSKREDNAHSKNKYFTKSNDKFDDEFVDATKALNIKDDGKDMDKETKENIANAKSNDNLKANQRDNQRDNQKADEKNIDKLTREEERRRKNNERNKERKRKKKLRLANERNEENKNRDNEKTQKATQEISVVPEVKETFEKQKSFNLAKGEKKNIKLNFGSKPQDKKEDYKEDYKEDKKDSIRKDKPLDAQKELAKDSQKEKQKEEQKDSQKEKFEIKKEDGNVKSKAFQSEDKVTKNITENIAENNVKEDNAENKIEIKLEKVKKDSFLDIPELTKPVKELVDIKKASKERLIGWIVSFKNPFGEAYELREGKLFVTNSKLKDNDFIIKDDSISTPHALISISKNGVSIQDLMSDTGVYVKHSKEDKYVKQEMPFKVQHGDWIKFGDVEYLISLLTYVGE